MSVCYDSTRATTLTTDTHTTPEFTWKTIFSTYSYSWRLYLLGSMAPQMNLKNHLRG